MTNTTPDRCILAARCDRALRTRRNAPPTSRTGRGTYWFLFGPKLTHGPPGPDFADGTEDSDVVDAAALPELADALDGPDTDDAPVTTGHRPGRIGVFPQ